MRLLRCRERFPCGLLLSDRLMNIHDLTNHSRALILTVKTQKSTSVDDRGRISSQGQRSKGSSAGFKRSNQEKINGDEMTER